MQAPDDCSAVMYGQVKFPTSKYTNFTFTSSSHYQSIASAQGDIDKNLRVLVEKFRRAWK
jgi:hypothetical protein